MKDRLHGLVGEKGNAVDLKVRPKLSGYNNKGKDELLQSRVSDLSIIEDLADLIHRLLDFPS